MSNFLGLYDIRDYRPTDEAYVISTFLKGNYYGHSFFRTIPQDVFFSNYRKIAEHFTRSGKATIKIACLKEDPDVAIGCSIMSTDFQILHWVHVKTPFRKHGIGRSLVPAHPRSVSHMNDLGFNLLHKLPNTIFDPFTTE